MFAHGKIWLRLRVPSRVAPHQQAPMFSGGVDSRALQKPDPIAAFAFGKVVVRETAMTGGYTHHRVLKKKRTQHRMRNLEFSIVYNIFLIFLSKHISYNMYLSDFVRIEFDIQSA
jgi:branched-subunit amino acid permease